jgi:hypothetical protein
MRTLKSGLKRVYNDALRLAIYMAALSLIFYLFFVDFSTVYYLANKENRNTVNLPPSSGKMRFALNLERPYVLSSSRP